MVKFFLMYLLIVKVNLTKIISIYKNLLFETNLSKFTLSANIYKRENHLKISFHICQPLFLHENSFSEEKKKKLQYRCRFFLFSFYFTIYSCTRLSSKCGSVEMGRIKKKKGKKRKEIERKRVERQRSERVPSLI